MARKRVLDQKKDSRLLGWEDLGLNQKTWLKAAVGF